MKSDEPVGLDEVGGPQGLPYDVGVALRVWQRHETHHRCWDYRLTIALTDAGQKMEPRLSRERGDRPPLSRADLGTLLR